jgi:hypothetical protein
LETERGVTELSALLGIDFFEFPSAVEAVQTQRLT